MKVFLPRCRWGSAFLAVIVFVSLIRAGWAQKQEETDPFAGIAPQPPNQSTPKSSWLKKFTSENFSFKKELYSLVTGGYQVEEDPPVYSRQSAGFELLKKFSTETSTVAAFDVQFRLVRRDNYIETLSDMEGKSRAGFFPEYHNVYLDLYNVFNPLLSESGRSNNLGRFNWRTGHFYVPFGINLQTDTHATLLQLSNEENFGFDRDWYTGLYGALTRDVNYDCYYLLGSGYYPRFRGQSGLLGARVSLGNRFRSEYGLEGGFSFMNGERISESAVERSASVTQKSRGNDIVHTLRVGLDGRYTRPLLRGTAVFTTELSGGEDRPDKVISQLHQFDYTSRSRKWGWAAQYRRFWQDRQPALSPGAIPGQENADFSLIGEFTLYLRNNVSASRLCWIKFNVERQLERMEGSKAWLFAVQYYFYW